MSMTHKQRIENALSMKSTDRVPYSMWMHLPNRDRHPRRLAEMSLAFQKKYDLDFIKFMPYGLFSTVDYGLNLQVFSGFERPPVASEPFIKNAGDWDKIKPVSGIEGEYAVVLEAQRILLKMMDERIPFIQTVFSPMTTALKLSSQKTLIAHMEETPHKLHRALEIITATTQEFAKAAVAMGADGVFFASQVSCKNQIHKATHDEFVRKYDMEILGAIKDSTWFNIHHIHGEEGMMQELEDYPVQAISWHDRNDGPCMDDVRKYSKKAFVGGLSHDDRWTSMSDEDIADEVKRAASCNGGIGTILGPGCVIDPATPESRLELVYRTVLETSRN